MHIKGGSPCEYPHMIMAKTTKRSIPEWAQLFKSFLDESTVGNTGTMHQIGYVTTVPLKTPSKTLVNSPSEWPFLFETPAGIHQIKQGPFSFSDYTWDSVVELAGMPEDLAHFLKATRTFLLDYENGWRQPFAEVKQILSATQVDLHTLKTTCENLSLNLGASVEIDDMHFPDAWTAIGYTASCFATAPEFVSMTD
jgi:hypothetical protein